MIKKVKIIAIIVFAISFLFGVWKLSSFIISKSYDSYNIVENNRDTEIKAAKIEDNPADSDIPYEDVKGNYGTVKQYEGDDYSSISVLTTKDILKRGNSPYKDIVDSAGYEVKKSGDNYIVKYIFDSEDLYVYCNSDGYPYEFAKSSNFSGEEDIFFGSLGIGEKVEYDGMYSWRYK